ncbi:MAG: AMP-binding protein [Syntrophaceae bacterium]
MDNERFWKKSYDSGLADLEGSAWELSYVEAVKEVFSRFPDKIALAYMGTHISFAELDRYANRFAHMLGSQGFIKGDVVGINLPNIPEYVIAWLGTLRAGCVVSGVSPLLSAEEMAYQLKDSRAKGLVTLDAIFAVKLTPIVYDLPDLKVVVAAGIGGFLSPIKRVLGRLLKKIPTGAVTGLTGKTVYRMQEIIKGERFPSTELTLDITPDDIAYLQYTGGTTGPPKGAMLTHRNAVADIVIIQSWLGWEQGAGVGLCGFPFFHIAGLFFNENAIYLGWTQILIPNPRDTDHICAELRRYQPRLLANVPSLYQMLMENPKFKTLDFSKLETCMSAAAPFPEEAQRKLEAIIGAGKLLEVYGMTETAPLITANPYRGRKQLGSVGLPLLNTDIRLIDPGTGKLAQPGAPGEICVKGPQVMAGYLGKPEETRQVFDADGYLHTGDVAVQDADGYLRIVDRTKDMIIVGGFKVFSTKVEEVLSRHPAVGMVALIGAPNPQRPGSEIVQAYITLKAEYQAGRDVEALKEQILAFSREKLSPYEIPKRIEIRAELPLTSVGKVDKKVLRQEARAQVWAVKERRTQERGKVDLPCDVRGVSNGRETRETGHVANLSHEGMFIEAETPLDEGTEIEAQISVIQFGNTFWVEGKVLRKTANGMAVRFKESLPPEIDTILSS